RLAGEAERAEQRSEGPPERAGDVLRAGCEGDALGALPGPDDHGVGPSLRRARAPQVVAGHRVTLAMAERVVRGPGEGLRAGVGSRTWPRTPPAAPRSCSLPCTTGTSRSEPSSRSSAAGRCRW